MATTYGTELVEYRNVYGDEFIKTRVYQLVQPVGPVRYILTMCFGSNPDHIVKDNKTGVRGRPRYSPNKSIWEDIPELDALDDGVVNEVEVIDADPDSDAAHELALTTAYEATLRFWEEDKHLVLTMPTE